ncbi:ABC transporter substrate-binding protein [Natronolimnohabitans sp. A-GB9]|uniref:ABC transporter substrate-binding protein n=1 Tax=Natronolimnohabitans sp. A-GB9 TaxID=3069757 RepID=UPI0027B78811|nr:ABC transporter substrate-binding protein [Natronolimnohabitans sp. A-GB9]MDQ2049799.1 ABC transporter substrate-binding protein [Natronolimnohabitans sp. A-GB9]
MSQHGSGWTSRRAFLTATGAGTLGAVAGCLGGEGPEEFVVTQGELAGNADPNDHNATPAYNVFDPVYEPLFDLTPDGEIQERIVTDWEHVDDGEIELTLRDDVVFHNGDEMTASDVAYTIDRQVDEEVGIPSPQADGMTGITGAEAEDETTVLVEHEVNPELAETGLGVFARVVDEEWVEEREQPIADEMNGTGPYQLVEFQAEEHAVYEVFDDYWGEEPPFDQLRFQAISTDSTRVADLETEASDVVTNVPPADVHDISEAEGLDIRTVVSFRNIFLVMPNDDEPFDSQAFRQAMNYAVDNEAIISDINDGFGEPMSQPVPEDHFGHNPDLEPYPYDPDEAESLIEESGYEGEALTLTCPDGRYLNDTDIAEYAASQIDELDTVSCEAEIVPFEDLVEMVLDGDPTTAPDFFLIGWGNPTYDSNYGLEPWFVEGQASYNFLEEDLEEPVLDQRIEEAILESQTVEDEDEREQLLQDINEEIHEAAAWVFLHNEESVYGVRSDLEWEPRGDERINPGEMEL